jgi:hypothetical protein
MSTDNRGLREVMKILLNWGRRKFCDATRELHKLREKLAALKACHARDEIRVEIFLIKINILIS